MGGRKCSVEGCDEPHRGKGFCAAHYQRWNRNGSPGGPLTRKRIGAQTCSTRGCDSKGTRGLIGGVCNACYLRSKRNGSPARVRAAKGEALKFLRLNVQYEGANCLQFPFPRMPSGYGNLGFNGRKIYAHRLMCMLAHGDPPFQGAQAAHSCGRGHEGCVNPNHLRWATQQENTEDSRSHGTLAVGERNHSHKLTSEDVRQFRKSALTDEQLAQMSGVTRRTVRDARARRTWKHVD